MKSNFYYDGHYKRIASKIKAYLNSYPDFLSGETLNSTRAVGDAVENLIAREFSNFLGDWGKEYSSDFARRAMADLAFTDKENFYSIVDVKTHREGTVFNMPNLTSVERLARFYESDFNVFSLIMVHYALVENRLSVSDVIFAPIEYLSWQCLTVGALGWGQIQISNSNNIQLIDGYSRKQWMLELCDSMSIFYPKEISKIEERINRFKNVKSYWENKEDVWL